MNILDLMKSKKKRKEYVLKKLNEEHENLELDHKILKKRKDIEKRKKDIGV